MSENPKTLIPSFDQMLIPVLKALKALGGTAQLEELDQKAIEIMAIPKAGQTAVHRTNERRTEAAYRLAWARTYLKKYGLIDNLERGIWSLSPTFDGNLDTIDPELIVRTVRNQNLEDFKVADVSNLAAVSAFERFALSALQDYAKASHKPIQLETRQGNSQYDAILPAGILGDSRRTYVEVRASWRLVNHLDHYRRITENLTAGERFLVILGERLSEAEKESAIKSLQGVMACEAALWDYSDLLESAPHEPDYIGYLSAPQKTLAEDAILRTPDNKEQRRLRQQRLDRLKEAYHDQNITLCVGAGVSIDAGIPLWSELIHRLLIFMISQKTQDEELKDTELHSLNQLACANQEDSPLTQVRYIRAAFEKEDYYGLVRKVLYETKFTGRTPLLNAISKISKPERDHVGVKSIITYNFDDLLERKLAVKDIKYNVVYRERDIPSTTALNIYHVHGYLPKSPDKDVDKETTLIFSEEDYHEVYRDAY